MRISIDVYGPSLANASDDQNLYHPPMTGCLETCRRLGKLAEAIEAFRIKWLPLERMETAPKFEIEIHIRDPLERKFHFKSSSRLFPEGVPWSEAIPAYLCEKKNLPKFISRYWNEAFPVSWQRECLKWQLRYPDATQAGDMLASLQSDMESFLIERQKGQANLVRNIGHLLVTQGAPEGLKRMMDQCLEKYG